MTPRSLATDNLEEEASTSATMASERRKGLAVPKSEDILDLEIPRHIGPAARSPPQALEQRAPGSRRGSRHDITQEPSQQPSKDPARSRSGSTYHIAEEAPQHMAKMPASSKYCSRCYLPERKTATSAPSVANTQNESLALKNSAKVAGLAKSPSKPVSPAPRGVIQKQAQVPPRSKPASQYELPVKTPERQGKGHACNIVNGPTGVAAGEPQKTKVTKPDNKEESQPYVTAPEPAKLAKNHDESELDNQRTAVSSLWLFCTVALLVTLSFLVILFLLESSQSLASKEKTTTTSSMPEDTTAPPLEREMIESAPTQDTTFATRTELPKTSEITPGPKEQGSKAPATPAV